MSVDVQPRRNEEHGQDAHATNGQDARATTTRALVTPSEDFGGYRTVNTVAMASLGIGALSFLALLNEAMWIIPIAGIVLALRARTVIRRNPAEFTGLGFARAGLALSLFFLLASATVVGVIYHTEVPPGYERISFSQLQPDPSQPGDAIPASARALEGKKVFLKGYVNKAVTQQKGLKMVVLHPDNGDCCFGNATPKLTDMVLVNMVDPHRLDYHPYVTRVAGTFHVEARPVEGMGQITHVIYHLDGEYAR